MCTKKDKTKEEGINSQGSFYVNKNGYQVTEC